MELKEFVRLDPKHVRRDNELMQLFVEFHEAAFSFTPKCIGCSFNSAFKNLKAYALNTKKIINFGKTAEIMKKNTFQLKNQFKLKILSYKEDGKTYRVYGYSLTEDFAIKLVEKGQGHLFITPPKIDKKQTDISEAIDTENKYANMDWRDEILPLYAKVKEVTGREAESRKKKDIIAFLKENEA